MLVVLAPIMLELYIITQCLTFRRLLVLVELVQAIETNATAVSQIWKLLACFATFIC
jgi:hypothetical protein